MDRNPVIPNMYAYQHGQLAGSLFSFPAFFHGAKFWSVPNAAHVGTGIVFSFAQEIPTRVFRKGPSTMVDPERTLAVNFSYQGHLVQTYIRCQGSSQNTEQHKFIWRKKIYSKSCS